MQNPFVGSGKAAIVRRLPDDVPSETVDDYIADAWSKATSVAPCIGEDDFPEENANQVKAVLRGIILRWHDAQSGVKVQQAAGPYQQVIDPGPKRGYQLWPSEILDLQRICKSSGVIFTIDTFPDEDDSPAKTFINGPHDVTVNPQYPNPNVPQIVLNGPVA